MNYLVAAIIWVVIFALFAILFLPLHLDYRQMRETTMATVIAARDIAPPETDYLGGGEWITRYIEREVAFATSSGERVQSKYTELLGGRPGDVLDSVALQTGHEIRINYNPSNPYSLALSSEHESHSNFMRMASLVLFSYLAILVGIGSKKIHRARAKDTARGDLFGPTS